MSELNNPAVVATVAMQVDGEGTSSADGAIDAGDTVRGVTAPAIP